MTGNPLPEFVSSLSKYHTVNDHFEILLAVEHDMPIEELAGRFHQDLIATARQRYLYIDDGNRIIRDKLIDLAHAERTFTDRMRMVMYFLFMFRDRRYRNFICDSVGKDQGKWDTSIFHSSSAGVVEFEHEGGRKAFTNLRRFLIHTNILDEGYRVHFPDLSTWFPWAVEICSQYIADDATRQHFLTSPHGFLIKYRLNALLNATPEELANVVFGGTYEEANDFLPTYVDPAFPSRIDTYDFAPWDRVSPSSPINSSLITSNIDPAALERANYQHFLLEQALVSLCGEAGLSTQSNRHVDLLARNDENAIIFEMKSSGPRATRSQVRRALSQVLEYKYLYREQLPAACHLCIVIERRPRGAQEWLIEYLSSIGVGLIWKNDNDDCFNCSNQTRNAIGYLLPQILNSDFRPRTQ